MESDVDAISELIEKEFIKDVDNSIDKRILRSDQFGYRSLHIVASLNTDRCNLREYKRYKNIKCEIQVRSILQHAWAEIEHDLGYKGEVSIPDQYKRTFNRLSALLETADIEFDRLKTELTSYEKEISSLISSEPESVDINKASIISFAQTNSVLREAKTILEEKTKTPLQGIGIEDVAIKRLKYLNFETIGQLEKSLAKNKKQYLKFAKLFIDDKIEENNHVSIFAPLMYFLHYIISGTKNKNKFEEYFQISTSPMVGDFEYYLKLHEEASK
ncbi:MAG: hypothetical protein JWR50_2308 [Mucilaginibacter sp.]|nr:hypothetical protein [Mucilaginibacter sp.]